MVKSDTGAISPFDGLNVNSTGGQQDSAWCEKLIISCLND